MLGEIINKPYWLMPTQEQEVDGFIGWTEHKSKVRALEATGLRKVDLEDVSPLFD